MSSVSRAHAHHVHRQQRVAQAQDHASACRTDAPRDSFQAHSVRPSTTWWAGRPLSEGKNAHKTNTKEQFDAAMKDGSNWFEGDIRKELHGNRVEMRHNPGAETGDNLTQIGRAHV